MSSGGRERGCYCRCVMVATLLALGVSNSTYMYTMAYIPWLKG